MTLEGSTRQERGVGPGAAGLQGVRVEMPKCLSILQAWYEMYILCFCSFGCLLSCDAAVVLRPGLRSQIPLLPTDDAW